MSRIVFTADVQLANHRQDATLTPEGLNSRLHYGLESLRQAALEAQGGIVVIDGDLFDHRRFLEIDVLVHTFRVIGEIAQTLDKLVIVVGNHDQFLRDGTVHSTEIFGAMPNVVIVDKWEILDLGSKYGELSLCCHAFTTELDDVRKFIQTAMAAGGVLVLHQEVMGATIGASTCKSGLSLGDLCHGSFEMVLLGHFHAPQEIAPNVHYIGSPYQVDRAEAGDDKRFIVWEDGQWGVIPVAGMPCYKTFTSTGDYRAALAAGVAKDIDFVELAVGDTEYAEAEDIAGDKATVKVRYIPPVADSEVSAQEEDVSSLSVAGAVELWLGRKGSEALLDTARARLA